MVGRCGLIVEGDVIRFFCLKIMGKGILGLLKIWFVWGYREFSEMWRDG